MGLKLKIMTKYETIKADSAAEAARIIKENKNVTTAYRVGDMWYITINNELPNAKYGWAVENCAIDGWLGTVITDYVVYTELHAALAAVADKQWRGIRLSRVMLR